MTTTTIQDNYTFLESNPPVLKSVTVRKHKTGCTYHETKNWDDCPCPKWWRIQPGRLRIPANTESYKQAWKTGLAWCKEHAKPKPQFTPKPIIETIQEYIDKDTVDKNLDPGTVKKLETVRNSVDFFVKEWNSVHKAAEALINIHELTTNHLRIIVQVWDAEMPEKQAHTQECDRRGSCECIKVRPPMSKTEKTNRRSILVRFFDHALDCKYMPDSGNMTIKGRMKKPIRLSNPAAHLVVTGRKRRAEDKMPLSDRMFAGYLFGLEVYCANRKCNHTDPNLLSRMRTYLRFLKRVGFSATDGYICRTDRIKRDIHGWYIEIRRLKTDKPVKARFSDKFYHELMNVPPGMKPKHPDFLFWSGHDFERAAVKARETVEESGGKIGYDKAYRDALHEQETNAYDTVQKLFKKLTNLLPRTLLYEECQKDEFGILIEPTLHCFRYSFSDDFLALSGGNHKMLGIAIGDDEEVARKHYSKRSPKQLAEVDAVLLRMFENEDEREALAVKQFTNVLLQQ